MAVIGAVGVDVAILFGAMGVAAGVGVAVIRAVGEAMAVIGAAGVVVAVIEAVGVAMAVI